MFKLLKESWLNLTLVLVILATVCAATFAWREDLERVDVTANSALVNVKLSLANNAESDPGVLSLSALEDGRAAYIPFQMENISNVPTNVYFTVHQKDENGEELPDAMEGWEIAFFKDSEELAFSDEENAYFAEVKALEEGQKSVTYAYTLRLKAAPDADFSALSGDTELYVTADVRIPETSASQE